MQQQKKRERERGEKNGKLNFSWFLYLTLKDLREPNHIYEMGFIFCIKQESFITSIVSVVFNFFSEKKIFI